MLVAFCHGEKCKTVLSPTPAENRFFANKEVVARKERILGASWQNAINQQVISC